jgi:hypothetical protein
VNLIDEFEGKGYIDLTIRSYIPVHLRGVVRDIDRDIGRIGNTPAEVYVRLAPGD